MTGANKLLLPSASSQQTEIEAQEGSLSIAVVHEERERRERHTLKILLTLLLIVCLYSLGSLSLAPHLLSASFFNAQAASPPASVGGGACTATPTDLRYLPPTSGDAPSLQLPTIWGQAGFTNDDFATAQACAASFVSTYQSFDANQPATFEACVSMLSAGAQQRFYGRAAGQGQPDNRMDSFWRASMQKQQISESARVSAPGLLLARFTDNRMLVWMQVHYQLTILRNGEKLIRDDSLTVLVASIPDGKHKWQVSAWKDSSGNSTFPAPQHL